MEDDPDLDQQNLPWSDQAAIISGGASGLGFALAQRLRAVGVTVGLFDSNEDRLRDACQSLGDGAIAFRVNVCDQGEVKAAVSDFVDRCGRLDILVNAAGITGQTNLKTHEVEIENVEYVFRVNLIGSLITFQSVAPHMLSQNYGRVLNVASIAGKEGNAGMVAYSASKAAVIGMTKCQGKEYAETGLTVNAIAPAVIKTAIHDTMPEEQIRYMTDKIPMRRCGTTGEFAATAMWIISPENSFSTGFTYDLSGGRAVY